MKFKVLFLIIIVMGLVVLTGCGDDKNNKDDKQVEPVFEPECTVDADCSVDGVCNEAKCIGGKCQTQALTNCCGNGECEEGEDKCTCQSDCETGCEGNVEFTLPMGGTQKAKYFELGCLKETCGIKYDPSQIKPNAAYHDLRQDGIVLGLTVDYIQPFEINHGTMNIELQLKDYTNTQVGLPVFVSEVRVMDGTILLGRVRGIANALESIGDVYTVEVPISYSMAIPEEPKTATIQIDYQYMKVKQVPALDETGRQERDENNQYIYLLINDSLKINTFRQSLAERIYFIDPNFDEVKIDFSQD